MHTMWKGSISFGLVNVPVRMFAATESKDIKFRYLHKTCKTPIQYTRTCPACQQTVEWSDMVRGFEYEPERFVLLDEEELNQTKKTRSQTIDISDFVLLSEIDPIYFDKTYYLAPETSGTKAYQLLRAAMRDTGKIAVAKTTLRNAQTLACLRTTEDALVMETLYWPDEVRSTETLPNVHQTADVTTQELDMAVTLINQLYAPFQADKYVDERRTSLEELIRAKIANEAPVASAQTKATAANIVDLMQALQESIKMTKPAVKKTRKRTS